MIRIYRVGDVTQLAMARTVFGRPLYVACAYYIDGLLLDNGPSIVEGEFARLFAQMDVRQAVLSHAHEDHAGNNPFLVARGLVPQAHPLALRVLAHPPHQRPYQWIVWGRHPASSAAPVGEELATRRYRFRVVHTPGHSPDHIALFEERHGWLFSGDLFLSPYVKVLRLDENPHEIIASLRKVLALPVTTVFCAGGKIVEDGRKALQRKLDFWERLREQARQRYERGMPPVRIRRELLGRETWWPIVTFGHFSKQNLIDGLLREDANAAT